MPPHRRGVFDSSGTVETPRSGCECIDAEGFHLRVPYRVVEKLGSQARWRLYGWNQSVTRTWTNDGGWEYDVWFFVKKTDAEAVRTYLMELGVGVMPECERKFR